MLWEIPSGKLVATLRGHLQAVVSVAFTPDGRTLVSIDEDGVVRVSDTAEPPSGGPAD